MPKNNIDLELLRKQCESLIKRSVYHGEGIGVKAGYNAVKSAKETDWCDDLEQIQWEALLAVENEYKKFLSDLEQKLIGIQQVRGLFQSQN